MFIHKQYRGLKAETRTKEHSKCALGKIEEFLKGVTGERSEMEYSYLGRTNKGKSH